MEVLAYFISPSSVSPDVRTNHRPARIFLGGRLTQEDDDDHLARFCGHLNEISPTSLSEPSPDVAVAFAPLRERLPFKWSDEDKYDTVIPFGDSRGTQYHAQWTFDIRDCTLHHANSTGRRQMPFSRLRERPVSLADMQLLGGPVPELSVPALDTVTSSRKPKLEVDGRIRAFTHRILRDFHHQWRHILRNPFNLVTIRHLARAIIRLVTLDFRIRENTGGHGMRGVHVWITRSPGWEPFDDSEVLRVGKLWIVLCEDLAGGLNIAQQHSASAEFMLARDITSMKQEEPQADFMILSVKGIVLCTAQGPNSLQCTSPVELFNGDDLTKPASDLALDYLIWATASARPFVDNAIQRLPVEIQDIILRHVSDGAVAAARFGCLAGIGSPFTWRDGPLYHELQVRYMHRPSGMPVESEIFFDQHKSGIVYVARWGRST
jgi:hypothetical protein